MVTIHDVAKLSGVSISTVSRALNGKGPVKKETMEKIMKAAKILKYSPNLLAQGLKEGSSKTIGMIIPDIHNPVFPEVAKGAEDAARKEGYQMFLCNTDENIRTEQEYIGLLTKRSVDGILLITASRDDYYVDALRQSGIPMVLCVRNYGSPDIFDKVCIDNIFLGYMAGRRLVETGCTSCAVLTGDTGLALYDDRRKGFERALNEAGLKLPAAAVLDASRTEKNGYDIIEKAYEEGQRFDGVFASCDFQSLGVVKYLQTHGIAIPGDTAVIGVDNLHLCSMCNPAITAIHQPLYECGELAGTMLISRLKQDGTQPARTILLDQLTLIEGETT